MKKVLLIVMMLLLLPSCAIIEIMLTLKSADKIEHNCRKACAAFTESSTEWCDCMNPCLDTKDNMKISIAECSTEPIEPKEPVEPEEPKEPIEPTEGAEGVMPEVPEVKMNILDGEINSGSITLKTEDIIKDCKKECVTFTISSDEWCECMDSCLNTKDNMKIKIADCEPDSIKSN